MPAIRSVKITSPTEKLKVKDLLATHKLYNNNASEWKLLLSLYEGIKSIIANGYITKHEREPQKAYDRRKNELFGFGYSRSVIELFHFYLFKKPPKRTIGALKNDAIFSMFNDDADLYGNSLPAVLMEISLYAAVLGHMGILVDKSSSEFQTRAQQIEAKVYPYVARYFPDAILDWVFERDENNRPRLAMIKLLDDDEQYRIWRLDRWEVWELPKDSNGNFDKSNLDAEAIYIDGGSNPLNEIPFMWLYNQKSKDKGIGVSDIHEIARIDLSIIRNLSQIEEIINFSAFPIMRKPMRDASPTKKNQPQQDDEVSVQSVQEFDPEVPESKPDWMPSSAAEPIVAILGAIEKKVSEIYRASNAGGMAATEIQTQAKSGVALKTEFQLLNAKLAGKAMNLDKTEMRVVQLVCLWEDLTAKYEKDYSVERDRSYDIENLAADLENAVTAKTVVISQKFDELLQKQTARQILPTADEDDMATIDQEIEDSVKKEPKTPVVPEVGGVDPEDESFIQAGGKAGNVSFKNNQKVGTGDGSTPPAQ